MRNLIDTNVWIDAIAGNLSKKAFLKISVEAEWAGYSAITRLELFGFPGLTEADEGKIRELFLLIRLNHKALRRWILWVYPVTVIQSTVSRTGVL